MFVRTTTLGADGVVRRELFTLHALGLIGPTPAEQVPFVLGRHGAESHHAHDEEDQEEDDSNNQNWHTSPLQPVWNAAAWDAVTAVTGEGEALTGSALQHESALICWSSAASVRRSSS